MYKIFHCLIVFIFSMNSSKLSGSAECDEYQIYIIKEGDDIVSIASSFGDERFRDAIYEANVDFVENLNLLTPGQPLRIPINIANYKISDLTVTEVLKNPACKPAESIIGGMDPHSADTTEKFPAKQNDAELLDEFREAFQALIRAEADTVIEENEHVRAEQQILLEIDGMVIDETRSKIGRDFYDTFYQYWQAPPNANRFTITISELPAPGLGSIIYVKVNDTETFRYRLQPRYDIIQEAGRYAVRMTYHHLQEEQREFIIY